MAIDLVLAQENFFLFLFFNQKMRLNLSKGDGALVY